MTLFRHEQTQQVIDVNELKPNVFDVLSTPMERSTLNSCGWWECASDPGYRGMPEANADEMDTPSVDPNPTTQTESLKD